MKIFAQVIYYIVLLIKLEAIFILLSDEQAQNHFQFIYHRQIQNQSQ
jgi:hypothetical protein